MTGDRFARLPVFAAQYTHGSKTYHVLVNGQSGQVQGERPWSWIKIGLLVGGIAASILTVFGIVWFVMFGRSDDHRVAKKPEKPGFV